MTLSGVTTPGQSGPESDSNEGVACISQSYSIIGTSTSDCLVTYPGYSLVGSNPSTEKQLVYSTAPLTGQLVQRFSVVGNGIGDPITNIDRFVCFSICTVSFGKS